MAEEPDRLIPLDEEIVGDHKGTKDFVFLRIGESVPLKPSDSSFDLEKPPSHPLAVSERFGVLFLAHSEGFFVARTKDVIGIAKEIKEKGKGPCIQESSVVDVHIGSVSILSLSTDSSTLAATVGGDIHFFSVPSLLNKEQEPSFSCSIDKPGIVKDFKWRKNVEKSFVFLSSNSSLYHGYLDGDQPKDVMNNVDAVDWSVEGDFIVVAKKNTLSILSTNFEERCHMTLLFKSWPNDSECSIKVDSMNWVCDDGIIVGCVRVDRDGNEDDYLVQVITSRENGFTESSCVPVVYSFPDLFGGIADAILPAGGGPYILLSYLERWELVLASNKKAIDDHFLLLGWSREKNIRDVVSLDFQTEMFPRIEMQENGDDNLILGLGVDKISLYEKVTVQVGSDIEERSPYCILMCLTCEGKLIMFHAVRISDHLDLPRTSVLPDDYKSVQEKNSTTILLDNDMPTTTSRLKDDIEGGILDVQSSQVTTAAPNIYTGKELKGIRNLDTFKEGGGDIPSGKKEQGSGGSTRKVSNISQLPVESAHIQEFNSSIPEIDLSSPGKGIRTTISLGNMSSEISAARQASTNRTMRSGEVGKGLGGSLVTAGASFGSQSTGKFFAGDGVNTKASTLSFSTSIPRDAQEKSYIGKGDKSSFSPQNSSSIDHLSGGRPFSLKDSTKEPSSLMLSSNKATLNEGHASWIRTGIAESVPFICGSPILTHGGSSPAKSLFSSRQPLLDNNGTSKSTQVLDSEREISEQFYNVKDMVKELDALLSSIEQEGGFKDACTVFQESSLLALEEGLENMVEISRRCKNKVEEQLIEIQHLRNRMLQVSARQVYTEGIIKQASNDQYWDIWNRQKLSPVFDLKRQNILNTNQNLTNQLLELERHFNNLEINRFGATGGVRTGRRASHSSLEPSRHTQPLHSVYNTLNSQLAAAQQLSECLSNQMAMLNLDKSSVKRLNVAKELFESIGLTHGASAFPSPDVKKPGLTPDCIERVSPSTSKAIKEYPRRNTSSAVKSSEPETARRRRDSLDRTLASFEPQKTTVKRMLQEGRFRPSADRPFRTTKGAFDSQLTIVQPNSNETPAFSSQSFMNKLQSDAYPPRIQEKPSKEAFEPQSNSFFKWAKDTSGSSHSAASKSNATQVLHGSITHPSSSSMVSSPSLLSRGQSNRNESLSLPDMPSTGMTRFGSQSNSSTEKSFTVPRSISSLQFETSTPNQTSSKFSSTVSPLRTTQTAKDPAHEQLNLKTGEDGLTRSFPRRTKQLDSPESVSPTSYESNISFPSSTYTVPSSTINGNTAQIDRPETVSTLPKVSTSTAFFLSAPSASTSSSLFSTSVTPSLPPTSFPAVSYGGKPIGETHQAAPMLPSSLTASSQSIPSSILSSFQSLKSPTSTSSPLPSESAVSQSLASHPIGVSSRTEPTTAQAPISDDLLRHSEVNFKLQPATSQGLTNEDGLPSTSEPTLLPNKTDSIVPATSNSAPEMPSVMAPILTATTTEKDESVDTDSSQEDEMEEEAPDTTTVLNLGALGGFGLGSTPHSSAPKPNPFGGSFVTASTSSASSLLSHTASPGELFRPASFNLPSAQPVQLPQPVNSGGLGGGFSGFGQPAQVGAGQQALGSVLGSFGQSRQIGAGAQGFGFASPGGFSGGGFSASANSGGFVPAGGFAGAAPGGGFTSVATGGGGFAGAAKGGGFAAIASSGGGFGAPATGGGFAAVASGGGGFAAAAPAGGGFGGAGQGGGFTAGGFGSFNSNQGGGFSAFGSNSATGAGRPPAQLFTQMRK